MSGNFCTDPTKKPSTGPRALQRVHYRPGSPYPGVQLITEKSVSDYWVSSGGGQVGNVMVTAGRARVTGSASIQRPLWPKMSPFKYYGPAYNLKPIAGPSAVGPYTRFAFVSWGYDEWETGSGSGSGGGAGLS